MRKTASLEILAEIILSGGFFEDQLVSASWLVFRLQSDSVKGMKASSFMEVQPNLSQLAGDSHSQM